MIIIKFWFAVCFLFLLSNLSQLFEDARSVKYLEGENDGKLKDTLLYSLCVAIDDSLLDNFRHPLQNGSYRFKVNELLSFGCERHYFTDPKVCNDSIILSRSYLFNHHLCFNFEKGQFDRLVKSIAVDKYKLFLHAFNRSEIFFYYNFEFSKKSPPFVSTFTLTRATLLDKGYRTDCHLYSNENTNFKTSETVFSRASCWYECLKSKSTRRSLDHYYSSKETSSLVIYQEDLERSRQNRWKVRLDEEIEKECRKLCSKKDCFLVLYLIDFLTEDQKTFRLDFNYRLSFAAPYMSNFVFTFQFLSLVALFFNISFLETVPDLAFRLIKKSFYLYLKFYKRYLPVSYLRKCYWALKICSSTLCWSLLILFSVFRIIKFAENTHDVLRSTNFPTEILPFNLAVCVPIQMFWSQSAELNVTLETDLLATKSFSELEKLTNFEKFKNGIKKIFVEYATIEKKVKYSLNQSKVLFRNFDYRLKGRKDSNFLTRCYEINFDTMQFDERRYEMLFSLSHLRLKLNFDWYAVFPLASKHQMNYRSKALFLKPNLHRITHKKNSKCKDYQKLNGDCSSKATCIDWCVLEQFRKKHSNLTTFAVVEKSKINQVDLEHIYFNRVSDDQILKKCKKDFKFPDCYDEYLEIPVSNSRPVNLKNRTFSMYLYYPEHIVYEDPHLTLADLLLNNLLNYLSIFTGLNVVKLFSVLFALLKRCKLLRFRKLCKFFKFLVCLLGFSFHSYILQNNALNELFYFQEFSRFQTVEMPNLIFCFKFNESEIDLNRKLTPHYLNELTNDLNLSFFRSFSFFDENYERIEYNQSSQHEALDKLEEFGWFYWLALKCVKFKFRSINDDRYLYLLKETHFVSITFNKKAILDYYNSSTDFSLYFINKKKYTQELNGIARIEFEADEINSKQLISIETNLVVFKQKDIFSYVKQPLSLLFETVNLNDTTEYVNQSISRFSDFNLRTKSMPLSSAGKDLDMEIDVRDAAGVQSPMTD